MTLRRWLSSAPFTLTMSSGFFGFFAHAGVLRVLEEEALLPSRVSGSSAGALVTGLWAAGMSSSLIVEELLRIDRKAFWDPAFGAGVLEGRLFGELLHRLLPVRTFAECRVPVAISVFDALSLRTRTIDSGDLAPAIRASCAVPLMFHPVRRGGRALFDGGILDRAGLSGVARDERVFYHHLTSRLPFASAHSLIGRGIPKRQGLVSFVIDDLPRCDPFHLDEGRRAVETAAKATRAALERSVSNGHVRYP